MVNNNRKTDSGSTSNHWNMIIMTSLPYLRTINYIVNCNLQKSNALNLQLKSVFTEKQYGPLPGQIKDHPLIQQCLIYSMAQLLGNKHMRVTHEKLACIS